MSLDEFVADIESGESGGESSESSKESTEKLQEQRKKSAAQSKRAKKDEKKAKKYDFLLAGFLVKIIVDKKYDFILGNLIECSHYGYPSNFVLGILSLLHIDVSDKIRETSQKQKIDFVYSKNNPSILFQENNLDRAIQNRINQWIEDIIDSVSIEYSEANTKKLLEFLLSKEEGIFKYTGKVLLYFLQELGFEVHQNQINGITQFILHEVEQRVKQLQISEI